MCGRFTIARQQEEIVAAFEHLAVSTWLGPRYNVAPTQPVPAVLNDGWREVTWIRWGLIPHWATEAAIGARMINARAESLAEKPSFRTPLEKQRCLVLADGFYEWQTVPGGPRQPVYFRLSSGRPFAFAGLWDIWHDPEGKDVVSCTIITCRPNERVAPIHARMPVILAPESHLRWLEPEPQTAESLADLLVPYPADQMMCFPVSTAVNRVAQDDPACIAPLERPLGDKIPGSESPGHLNAPDEP